MRLRVLQLGMLESRPHPQQPEDERRAGDPQGNCQEARRASPYCLSMLLHVEREHGGVEAYADAARIWWPRCRALNGRDGATEGHGNEAEPVQPPCGQQMARPPLTDPPAHQGASGSVKR